MARLAAGLTYVRSLERLRLGFFGNRVGDIGAQRLGQAVQKLQKLTHLDLDFTHGLLTNEGAKDVGLGVLALPELCELAL